MTRPIQRAAVLGAGTMGAQIAAHLANAGVPVHLLDLSGEAARAGLERLRKTKPDPCFLPDTPALIRPGGLDDLGVVADADWVIEAIVESLEAKRDLLARLEPHLNPDAIVSSNTSAIPLRAIAEGRSPAFRRRWLGTHFFNPPRYLYLLEIIPIAETDPDVTARLSAFADRHLGKGVVPARDRPGFIGNRIGMYGALRLVEAAASGEFSIEEIEAVTGRAIGRPSSATFRTLDLVGLDIFAHVAADLATRLSQEEGAASYVAPPLIKSMLERKLLGAKTGEGFYKRVKDGGDSKILVLDVKTLEFRESRPASLPSVEAARTIGDTGERIRTLFLGRDRVAALLRQTLGATLIYAARVAPDIAGSIDDVDRAMRWGFGWDLGPFETLDAIGLERVVETCGVSDPPPLLRDALAGPKRFRPGPFPPAGMGRSMLRTARTDSRSIVQANAGASLIDLGDGVLCVEFHSKMNALGGDAIEMIQAGVARAASDFAALVVGNEGEHFSAGANLMLLLLEAQEGNWDEIEIMVRQFQRATMALKLSAAPVVVAPAGLALGGGCEVCLHGDRVRAAAETYMGLVEVGVGLIPAGGGTKEMLLRAVDAADTDDIFPNVQAAFQAMGLGKVSTSAADARRIGYLRPVDGIVMNRERLIAEAKAAALARVRDGYQPPVLRSAVPVGGPETLAKLSLGVHLMHRAGRISDHDALVGRKLAGILAGGDLPHAASVTETYLLDLEREAFLSLCGEPKTQERIGYTLKTGKTLRN
jgi:3-hydroxyacyl-CoA dehydrogenase